MRFLADVNECMEGILALDAVERVSIRWEPTSVPAVGMATSPGMGDVLVRCSGGLWTTPSTPVARGFLLPPSLKRSRGTGSTFLPWVVSLHGKGAVPSWPGWQGQS